MAVDPAGNRSDFSEVACGDNCPFFKLPNVITPGKPDGLNDVLAAFGRNSDDETQCVRFVKRVDLRIINRWGKEIHLVDGITGDNNSVFWDGYLNNGLLAGDGVYFYEARVTFDVRDPALRELTVKGWVHVITGEK